MTPCNARKLTICLVIATAVCGGRALAGFAVSPLQQRIAVKPGETSTFRVTVTNTRRDVNATAVRLEAKLLDFDVDINGRLSFGDGLEEQRSAAPWIRLDADRMVLGPGESREIVGTVSAPLDADGDYWAALMIAPPPPKEGEPGVRVILRTASGIFVDVARRHYAARPAIEHLAIDLPRFDEEGQANPPALRVALDGRNLGKTHFSCRATARIYDSTRRQVAEIPLFTHRPRILPSDARRFEGVMSAPLPAGEYTAQVSLQTDSIGERTAFERTTFAVPEALAEAWRRMPAAQAVTHLHLDPPTSRLELSPGRFTVAGFSVTNPVADTMRVTVRVETDTALGGWVDLPDELVLRPRHRAGLACRLRVPPDAAPGEYAAKIVLEGAGAGLVGHTPTIRDEAELVVNIGSQPERGAR